MSDQSWAHAIFAVECIAKYSIVLKLNFDSEEQILKNNT